MPWRNAFAVTERRGSRPRCLLLVDGDRDEVAQRLSELVNINGIEVTANHHWKPTGKPILLPNNAWDKRPATEPRLTINDDLLPNNIPRHLRNWWLNHDGNTPNWDLASTCTIQGQDGLILFEAKAHSEELSNSGKSGPDPDSIESQANHERIGYAIGQARAGLQEVTLNAWNISRDSHYQLSNRFAWCWKLASLGVPVVLVYLGFLNADEMADQGQPFLTAQDWIDTVHQHGHGVVEPNIWEQQWNFEGTLFYPLLRSYHQPLPPLNAD